MADHHEDQWSPKATSVPAKELALGPDPEAEPPVVKDGMLHPGLYDGPVVEESRNDRLVRKAKERGIPYCVFWAPDLLATMVLKEYERLVEIYQGDDHAFLMEVTGKVQEFIAWQRQNSSQVKLPD